jgi:predicted transcriptional regulator
MLSTVKTLRAMSNERTLSLFKTIAISKSDTDILITKLNLTRKEYYSRLKMLMEAGLIRKRSGRYCLTSFGIVIHDSYIKIETALKYYWKLKAIDSIMSSTSSQLPHEERGRIIDALVDNYQIKDILFIDHCEPPIRTPEFNGTIHSTNRVRI